MDLNTLPATVFPTLLYEVLGQSLRKTLSSNDYMRIAEVLEETMRVRRQVVLMLANLETEAEPISTFKTLYKDVQFPDHGYIFGLYLLGDYLSAAEQMEKEFEKTNFNIFESIRHRKIILGTNEAQQSLRELIFNWLSNTEYASLMFKTREKNPASVFAKMVNRNMINLSQLINQQPEQLDFEFLPYDLVGGRIIVSTTNEIEFSSLVANLRAYFEKADAPLTDQRVFCTPELRRASMTGKLRTNEQLVPFQLHIWDVRAERFESMSYGNYKMNKIAYPIIARWRDHLEAPLSSLEYSNLVVSSLSAGRAKALAMP